MKKTIVLFLITGNIILLSSCNNDTTTQMPDSGYKERTDTATMPANLDEKSRGAVGVDSMKNGQMNTNGASITDTSKKADSSHK